MIPGDREGKQQQSLALCLDPNQKKDDKNIVSAPDQKDS